MTEIPNPIKLQIGIDGVSDIKFHPSKNTLVVGTVEGRVRIYDCNGKNASELFRKKWHKNLTKISISKSGSRIATSSSQGAIKEHDFETGAETWAHLRAHETGVSTLIHQTETLLISGDDEGVIKYWDSRQKESIGELNVCAVDDEGGQSMMALCGNYLSSINDLVLDSSNRFLFVAMDDGTLVTVNNRKRKIELRSETLGYSARSIVTLKDQAKLGVTTDEGVITIYNWNQFGNLTERFRIAKKDILLEKTVKINENILACGTNTGVIKAVSIQPNLVLADLGVQLFPKGNEGCGDCMTIDVNFDKTLIASSCPESNIVCFFSSNIAIEEFSVELKDRSENKRKKERTVYEVRKKRRINVENDGFLSGLCEVQKSEENSEEEDESDDSTNEDEEIESVESCEDEDSDE